MEPPSHPARRRRPARSAWTWFTIALAASLGANVATAGLLDLDHVPGWLRILVAGWPALAFLGGTLLVHTATGQADGEPLAEESAADDAEPSAGSTDVEREPAADSTPAPALPAVEPVPEPDAPPEPTPAPAAVTVPPALVAHARKVADDHHARTGTPIDPGTLRARLGVPPSMADAIAAQLA